MKRKLHRISKELKIISEGQMLFRNLWVTMSMSYTVLTLEFNNVPCGDHLSVPTCIHSHMLLVRNKLYSEKARAATMPTKKHCSKEND